MLAWDVSKDSVDYELGLTTEQADCCRWIGITCLRGAVGIERQILENRKRVHEAARAQNPSRWSREARDWTPVEQVELNAEKLNRECGEQERKWP